MSNANHLARFPASISLDLDNKWSYLKIHGNKLWESYPSYLEIAIPRILDFLDSEQLRITFFIVGTDANIKSHHSLLAKIAQRGHEIGNHSFHHESWMHTYSEKEVLEEIQLAEQAIEKATGVKTRAYRGPGYSLSPTIIKALHKLNYRYDASTWPSFVGPLARLFYLSTGKFSKEQKRQRKLLFGSWKEGLRPLQPYYWSGDLIKDPSWDGRLLEIPVSTLPLFRLPVHFSYLIYLSSFSKHLTNLYVSICCKTFLYSRTSPSLLLHSLDFLGPEDDKDLEFFPGMKLAAIEKMGILRNVINQYKKNFELLALEDFIKRMKLAN